MKGKQLAHFLRAIAQAVENADDSQIDNLIASLSRLTPNERTTKPSSKPPRQDVDEASLQETLERIGMLSSREEGLKLLEQLDFKRKDLLALAKLRDVHTSKDDSVLRLREKLVERLIGARLNSQAIRGT
ncbi:hypothetical protein [Bradyrhizobium diazoefficiens]|uniref:Uncharacterized protein n=1 Tax=Bradyrhizobium diazoefficiens TaxID=1355477 RepID=A0A809XJN0_9BRAD|nr:hypothetical protein XF2B_07440 [Bradyrhizobium diazoefficiens]BCF14053.1 hypothetical protein XF13B_07440 [Bradyrhizobium diazoefficiens]